MSALSSAYSISPISGTTYTPDPASISQYTVSYNPCSPTLSAPSEIYTIEPGWSTCVRAFSGLWDPPYALKPGASTLGSITATSVDPIKTTSATAVQGSTPSQTLASPTATATQDPTTQPTSNESTAQKSTAGQTSPDPSTKLDPPTGLQPSTTLAQGSSDPAIATSSSTPFVVIGSQTISAGQSGTYVSGTVVSLQTDGSSIVVGSSTLAVSSLLASDTVPTFTVGSQTLTPGGSVTVTDASGATSILALAGSASVIVGGSRTVPVSQVTGLSAIVQPTTPTYILGSQTLTQGGAITVVGPSGTSTLSLDKGGSSVIVGGSTIPISQVSGLSPATPATTPTYVVDGQTLTPGAPAITIGTNVMSLEAGGSSVVVGGSTIAVSQLSGLSTASDPGIGKILLSMGGYATPTSASWQATGGLAPGQYNGTVFTGAGSRKWSSRNAIWALMIMLLGIFR